MPPPDTIDSVFGIPVEQREIPRPGGKKFFFNSHTQIGVLHTTESDSLEGSFSARNVCQILNKHLCQVISKVTPNFWP